MLQKEKERIWGVHLMHRAYLNLKKNVKFWIVVTIPRITIVIIPYQIFSKNIIVYSKRKNSSND